MEKKKVYNLSVKVFVAKKKNSLSSMPAVVKTMFNVKLNSGEVDVKNGYQVIVPVNKNSVYVLAKLKDKYENEDLQILGAKLVRKLQEIYKNSKDKEYKIDLKVNYTKGFTKLEKDLIDKGILLALQNDEELKENKQLPEINYLNKVDEKLKIIVEGIYLARELTYKPSNIITAEEFVKKVKSKLPKNVEIKLFNRDELKKEKMNLFLAVAQGSENSPIMMLMHYKPKNKSKRKIGLVGKGLIYDSGGYYAKPYPYMNDMYGDMAGAATVAGIMYAVSKLNVEYEVVGAVGLAENLIDAKSYRPGDVIKSRKGKTVEIDHTDAEGRLVLADILTYVDEVYKPDYIIDFATLTGAAIRAVGEMYTGVFEGNKRIIELMRDIGNKVNDKVWQLPLDKDCKEVLKSKIADIRNVAKDFDGMLGASTAAAFLSEFISKPENRVHCDIAGTALRNILKRDYDLKNGIGTGPMIHNVVKLLLDRKI